MIITSQQTSRRSRADKSLGTTELEALRAKINSAEYVHEAIHRIAMILSNELLDIPQGGRHEQQRKGRR